MPASFAFCTDSCNATGSGMEMARPSGSEATAASISWLICTMSNVSGALYSTSTPMSAAAWSTPFLTTDQNGSEACPWVTTAILMSFRAAPPPPSEPPPPSPPQPATTTSAASVARTNENLIFTLILSPFHERKALANVKFGSHPFLWLGVLLQHVPPRVSCSFEHVQQPSDVHVAQGPKRPLPPTATWAGLCT